MHKPHDRYPQDDDQTDDDQTEAPEKARAGLDGFKDEVDRAMEQMWAAHRSFPKPVKPPVHFNFKTIEYRLASQINALDTLFWSLSFRGVDSDSAEVGAMTVKLALAAQNQCRTTYQALVERYGRAASAMAGRGPLPPPREFEADAEPDSPFEPRHAPME